MARDPRPAPGRRYHSVNYEDPNYNIQLPVFSIHGNHDDPAGDGGLAALDLLATANLVNYFGRVDNFEKICLKPLLITKGDSRLALYGLGHVRDERLARCFEHREVSVARPVHHTDQWFSILALHQNRLPRGATMGTKGYIKEQSLPSCFDLVVWGHEHECMIGGGMDALPDSVENEFVVVQPGSTVATALVEGEAKPKHVALLSVLGDKWNLDPIPLTTVRPFVIKEVALEDHDEEYDLHKEEGLMRCLEDQVNAMLATLPPAPTPLVEAGESRARLPLARLKVDYTGYSTCNPQRFGQRFVDRVANPCEILLFQKTKVKRRLEAAAKEAAKRARGGAADPAFEPPPDDEEDPAETIQGLVRDFLASGKDAGGLRVLPQADLNNAVFHEFVGKDNKAAIRNQVEASLKATQAFLGARFPSADASDLTDKKKRDATFQQLLAGRQGGAPGLALTGRPTPDAGGGSAADWGLFGGGGGGVHPGGAASSFDVPMVAGPSRLGPLGQRSHGSTNAHMDPQQSADAVASAAVAGLLDHGGGAAPSCDPPRPRGLATGHPPTGAASAQTRPDPPAVSPLPFALGEAQAAASTGIPMAQQQPPPQPQPQQQQQQPAMASLDVNLGSHSSRPPLTSSMSKPQRDRTMAPPGARPNLSDDDAGLSADETDPPDPGDGPGGGLGGGLGESQRLPPDPAAGSIAGSSRSSAFANRRRSR